MKDYIIIAMGVIVLILSTSFIVNSQSIKNRNLSSKCPNVRYVIANNWADEDTRYIDVLIEKPCFSSENLNKVIKLVIARFRIPKMLDIRIFTDMRDIQTPEERDETLISGNSHNDPTYGNQAVATIENMKGFFYIYFKNGKFEEVKII